jgi:hypothetical protein
MARFPLLFRLPAYVRSATVLVGSVIGPSIATAAQAGPEFPPCHASFDRLLSNEVFNRYPARVSAKPHKPVPPDVRRGTPHLYRTVIRQEAKQAPDFAGNYILIRIGCGAATVCPAILDANTGTVFFPPKLRVASALLLDTGDTDVDTLNYRQNSRLLIVFGTPNENPKNDGMSYYLWRSDKLTLIRFVPTAKLCRSH